MVVEDIGYWIFVEFLRMSQYPGSPFTGEIIRDLVMFFFIPTVFIILIIYMLLGRMMPVKAYPKMRLLVGVAIYLFVIFGGYYSVFAYLAGPYFIFLIFIMGILYYFMEHFRRRSGGAHAYGGAHEYRGGLVRTGDYTPPEQPQYEQMDRQDLLERRDRVISLIKDVDDELKDAKNEERKESIRMRRLQLKDELKEINDQLTIVKKPRFF